jgi:hypothetical protein
MRSNGSTGPAYRAEAEHSSTRGRWCVFCCPEVAIAARLWVLQCRETRLIARY